MSDNKKPALKFNQLSKMLEHSNARELALATLVEGLEAERSYYDVLRKSTVTEKDFKTRAQCAEILLAYTDGRPVERKEIISTTMDSLESYKERLKQSAALRKAFREMLDDAERPAEAGATQVVDSAP